MFVSHAQRAVTAQENWKRFDETMLDEYTALTEELVLLSSHAFPYSFFSLFFMSLFSLIIPFQGDPQE
jgi:hypothetical protein